MGLRTIQLITNCTSPLLIRFIDQMGTAVRWRLFYINGLAFEWIGGIIYVGTYRSISLPVGREWRVPLAVTQSSRAKLTFTESRWTHLMGYLNLSCSFTCDMYSFLVLSFLAV